MVTKIINRKVISNIQSVRYCSENTSKNKLYSNTLLLPKTKFPLRLDTKKHLERNEKLSNETDFNNLYIWQRSHLSEPEFVLHDGPPYANGKLHMGHAINKILKDTILRYEILKGNKIHYVPGWDCHGLPIELKASIKTGSNPIEIRTKAREFAKNTINEQKKTFKSWGIMGDWKNHYATYNPNYYKIQFKLFHKMYIKNLIYRDFKPVYWSPSSRTALAEAELEYDENFKSPSAYIRVKLNDMPAMGIDNNKSVYALIWTTTPWTLPSNQGVCFNPLLKYSVVKKLDDNNFYIVASDLIDSISKTLNTNFEILHTISGEALRSSTYIHPIFKDKQCKFYPASHVTLSKGTGLVHTAPAHGPEDFLIGLNNNLKIVNLVNELGCYNETAGEDLHGKFVLKEGNAIVLNKLQDDLIHLSDYIHSYPLDWRTKKPVILRASQQWFFDTNSIKSKVAEILETVNVYPKTSGIIYKQNLLNQIQKRPYWCISRQRKWGVPIPVFFENKSGTCIINEDIIRHISGLVDKFGTDFWWNLDNKQLIPSDLHKILDIDHIKKSEDILDIWFDSGISWANVLDGNKVADMYLEGVDQFTGWFQSSLITSIALRDKAPYKNLYVHGFAVDDKGRKMSKSLGNVIDPEEIVNGVKGKKGYGIDVLRWWVTCHANQDSVAQVSSNVLERSAEEIQKIRAVLRFALGSLEDFPNMTIKYQDLSILDKYILHQLFLFNQKAMEAIEEYQFHRINSAVNNLLSNYVSALYYTAIKDRLYCDYLDSNIRRSSQFVLLKILEIVSQVCAPIIPHLIEEIYFYLPQKQSGSYFITSHCKPDEEWNNMEVNDIMEVVLSIKKQINKELGSETLPNVIEIKFSEKIWNLLKKQMVNIDLFKTELEDILQVSEILLISDSRCSDEDFSIITRKSTKFSCPRCRLIRSKHENDLCSRCKEIVDNLTQKKTFVN